MLVLVLVLVLVPLARAGVLVLLPLLVLVPLVGAPCWRWCACAGAPACAVDARAVVPALNDVCLSVSTLLRKPEQHCASSRSMGSLMLRTCLEIASLLSEIQSAQHMQSVERLNAPQVSSCSVVQSLDSR